MRSFLQNKKEISDDKFDELAYLFLNKSILIINEKKYRICEIEFYLKNDDHNDKYTHCNDDQAKYGKFYFHKYGNGSYKGGTYKGMDITFGNENSHCGVLIRSIYNTDTKEFIEGPCRTVNKILEEYSIESINELTNNKLLSVLENEHDFCLKNAKMKEEIIYKGKRVGLSDKYPNFRNLNYRYLVKKNKIKKQKADLIKVGFTKKKENK
jgi:3-methyladenine DNA glycosylase Mpg